MKCLENGICVCLRVCLWWQISDCDCNLASTDVAELTMPVVEYGKDDEELLNQSMKKYQHEMSEENDGYSVIVTVPSNAF